MRTRPSYPVMKANLAKGWMYYNRALMMIFMAYDHGADKLRRSLAVAVANIKQCKFSEREPAPMSPILLFGLREGNNAAMRWGPGHQTCA